MSFAKSGALRPELFNRVLDHVKGHDFESLVNEVVLRSQAQAEYSAENYGHFGLNLRRYAHFTSPIRRYADLIVHRALIRALGLGDGALPDSENAETLAEIAAQISVTERRAMKAERETADRLIAHFLADRIGNIFEGRISGVTRAGLFVKLTDTGADGLIPIRSLGTEYFKYDETRHALVGSRSGSMHKLGDVVEVRLVEAVPLAGALRFELLSGAQVGPRDHHARGGRKTKAAAWSGHARHPEVQFEGPSGPQTAQDVAQAGQEQGWQTEEGQIMTAPPPDTASTAAKIWTREGEKRDAWAAVRRGFFCRCPRCGEGKLFRAFLKTADNCSECGLDFTPHRADDLPAYLVIVVVGHIVVPLALLIEKEFSPPLVASVGDLFADDAVHGAMADSADQGRR